MVNGGVIVNLGSTNPVKIEAVRRVFQQYDFLNPLHLNPKNVSSGVREQPFSEEEIMLGAKNRARESFLMCSYGVGYESGIVLRSGQYLDTGVCLIYDGENFYRGDSYAFVVPPRLIKIIQDEKVDLSQAAKIAGLTNLDKIGEEKGIINILSKGKFTRTNQIESAVNAALINLIGKEFYR